jgi:hypothetical protein
MNKNSKKQKKATAKKRPNRQLAVARPVPSMDGRVRNHVRMLLDPCNAPLAPTAYRGADGFMTRFKRVDSSMTHTSTPYFIHVYYPAYNSTWAGEVASATAALTPAFNIAGPGQAFLLANADSQRVVSACVQMQYTGSELYRQGIVFRGVLPIAAIAGSSINELCALCQATDRMSDSQLETKWIPSPSEEEYWATSSVAPDAVGDRNVIVTIIQGSLNIDMTFNFVTTLIGEWRPKFGIGMQVPSPNTQDTPAGLEKVRTTIATLGNWWIGGAKLLAQVAKTGAQAVNATRVAGAAARVAMLTL